MIFHVACWVLLCLVHILLVVVDVRLLQAWLTDAGQSDASMEGHELIVEDDLTVDLPVYELRLPHDKLVCQAVDSPVLDLYFRHTSRSSHVLQGFPIVARDQQEEHRLVFMSCICMPSYKDSEDSHITPSVYGVVLYEKFTVDIPTLMYMCVLDVQGSGTFVAMMIDSMWTQPTYMDDLVKTVTTLSEDSHITPSVFEVALYENFTVDIPTLTYLCVLDGQGNGALVAMMIDSMWTQPTYMDDLVKTVTTLSEDSHITPSVFEVALYEKFTVDIPTLTYLCVLDGQGNGAFVAMMIDSMWTQPTYMDDLVKTVTTLSEDSHITPSVFEVALYENFTVDIPTLMYLCVLDGRGNGILVAKMIHSRLTQPTYMDDLIKTLTTLSEVSDVSLVQCDEQFDLGTNQLPLAIELVELIDDAIHSFPEVPPSTACRYFHNSLVAMRDEAGLNIHNAVNLMFSISGITAESVIIRGGHRPDGAYIPADGAIGGNTGFATEGATGVVSDYVHQVELPLSCTVYSYGRSHPMVRIWQVH